MEEKQKKLGFGLIGIIIVVAIIGLLAGGGLYFREGQQRKSQIQQGLEAEKQAKELRDRIMNQQRQQLEVAGENTATPQPSPIDTSSWKTYPSTGSGQAAIDTSEWKLYRNEEFGFEVRYPANLVDSSKEGLLILKWEKMNEESPYLSISVDDNPKRLTMNDYYDGDPGKQLFGATEATDIVDIIVGGRKGKKFNPYITFAGGEVVVIPLDSWFLQISDSGGTFRDFGLLDQILSTFKFIPLEK